MYSRDKLKARRNAAQRERDSFQPLLDEAYQYAIPYRKSLRRSSSGEKRVNQAFDHTAVESAFRFAGKLQQDLMPAGQQNFELAPGPLVTAQQDIEQLRLALAPISQIVQAFFEDGDWDLAFHEMAIDLSAGTGAILMNSTSDPERLWEPISVSIDELLLEAGPNGRINGVFWDRKAPLRVIFETWPEGKFSQELQDLYKTKPETEIEFRLDTVFVPPANGRKGIWKMCVWCEKQEALIYDSQSRTCPWLVPRYFRVPGESYGRGLVMLAMPTIKTLNTAARLQLQAAAIAMLGIYTAVDDGVFNPDLSPVEPGAFWKVARNGGTLGPSIQKFQDPRLDLTGLVLQDLRGGVKNTMMDGDLPLNGEAVKSPTEILERVKKLSSDHVGAFGRLVKEIIVPAVKRALEIAYDKGLVKSDLPIDQLLVKVTVKSPMALARQARQVDNLINWLQLVLGIESAKQAAPGVSRIAETDLILSEAGTSMGVPPRYIVPTGRREAIDKDTANQIAQAQIALMAKAAGGGGAA